ncbi:GH92 family glycosyl hydrolase [Bacteroides sedimenti]|uniref:Glycoside hydrolase family 92 protein n=1 Tax=Bacteroides sedimenti TaxID=2136147 RepID=A0ABM8IG16_9BACE
MRNIFIILLLFALQVEAQDKRVTDWVDPFIGTDSFDNNSLPGNVYPGATYPFGMIQLSPDTQKDILVVCGGYYWKDKEIYGFSHSHISGTGIADLYDILVMPTCGKSAELLDKLKTPDKQIKSSFSHKNEYAEPGYYSVLLNDSKVKVELTTSEHVGLHRYVYPSKSKKFVVVDLNHGITKDRKWFPFKLLDGYSRVLNDSTIIGYRFATGWARLRKVYFALRTNQPISHCSFITWGNVLSTKNTVAETWNDRPLRALLEFNSDKKDTVEIKISLSTVSSENALNNIITETGRKDFDKVKEDTQLAWEKELSKIEIKGDLEQKKLFYTALYRTFLQPNNIADVNGEYTRGDFTIGKLKPGEPYFTQFSLWDTFRAAHPLYTILQSQRTAQIINSMLDFYDVKGILPVWHLWGVDNYCMIGNHAIPVIVDAYKKGIRGFDYSRAYEAIKGSANSSHVFTSYPMFLDQYGYYPHDGNIHESVSVTLESSFDDWCVAQMAKSLEKYDDFSYFYNRSKCYRNLFDIKSGFFRPKLKNGSFFAPFDPYSYYGDGQRKFYTEANAFQYQFSPVHEIDTLVEMMGGKRKAMLLLDNVFNDQKKDTIIEENASGFIGQYAHGNEPCHHYAYIYNYLGNHRKTEEQLQKIVKSMYRPTPQGLCGNDDCGQMSAWLVFTMMGFYPLNPASGVYEIGTPFLPYAKIKNDNGSYFEIIAHNLSDKNIHIKKIALNGEICKDYKLTHSDIIKGGKIEFFMGK